MTQRALVEVKNLKQYFGQGTKREVRAIDNISFEIYEGETFGLVGESGSGKSTTGRSIIKLYDPTSGDIIFDGVNIADKKSSKDRKELTKQMQMIFQDPAASLNPRMKVVDIIAEGLDIHGLTQTPEERRQKVEELLKVVGLNPNHASRYPHEFSGGQKQRIGIARALAVNPKFIIADEPISALDVSIQAQVVNLMQELQEKYKLTYLFIAHDLSMVKYISNRIGVMYMGKLVEVGDCDEIYNFGVHPYTESLLSAVPLPDPDYERQRQRIIYEPVHDDKERMMVEIAPNHFIYCSEDEVAMYQEKLAKKKAQDDPCLVS
jgi:oligopeptide transport system ATP-binding protein